MSRRAGVLANVAIAVAAVAVGGSAIYDTFIRPTSPAIAGNPLAAPEYVRGWELLAAIGLRVGNKEAPVHIVEFADLECPFCAAFEAMLQPIVAEYDGLVSRTVVHYPLSMHSKSRRAAHALECGSELGETSSMMLALYDRQREFGREAFVDAAAEVGIADTASFRSCLDASELHGRVEAGYRVARALEIGGTPTVIINGWLYPSPPSDSVLRSVIDSILRSPDNKRIPTRRVTRTVRQEWIDEAKRLIDAASP